MQPLSWQPSLRQIYTAPFVAGKELRLELFFLTNALVAVLGIVATVNGKDFAAGVSEIDWKALTGVIVIALAGGILGLLWWNIRNRNKEKKCETIIE